MDLTHLDRETEEPYVARLKEQAIEMFKPVMESAIVVAAEYCKSTGRTVVVAKDMEYGMKFAARHVLGQVQGTMFPELEDEQNFDDEQEDEDETEEEEEEWTRYEGDNEQMNIINQCVDTWSEWSPPSDAHRALKDAIEKTIDLL